MADDREITLADFQACSGIDDIGEAIMHLESSDWDLVSALNKVVHHDTQQLPSEMSPDVEMIEAFVEGVPVIKHSSSTSTSTNNADTTKNNTKKIDDLISMKPGTSKVADTSLLKFKIHYLDKTFKINIPDNCTVGDLKAQVCQKVKVPNCKYQLDGWKKESPTPSTVLKSLNLQRAINILFLRPIAQLVELETSDSVSISMSERLARVYILKINDKIQNKNYSLQFPGTQTVRDVKAGIYALNDVPIRNQKWIGWPLGVVDDDTLLGASGINYPEHHLIVSKNEKDTDNTKLKDKDKKNTNEIVDIADSDNSDIEDIEEFEDTPGSFLIEDDIFIDNISTKKIQRLIPDNINDEINGTINFSKEFEIRYGPSHPNFFNGKFEDAIKESCLTSAKDRKLLGVYLHHDNSVLSNVFCTHLLGCETVLQLLAENFIVYGWDFTFESNKDKFLNTVQSTLGVMASETIRTIDIDTFPVLIIIMRLRSATDIFTIVRGNVGVNDLLTSLIHAVDVFQDQRRIDINAEEERQARELVKQEQDKAYQESLDADRAKEEAKLLQIKIEKQLKEKAENERILEEARKESIRTLVESSLPAEPDETIDNIYKIKVRIPGGKLLERRFLHDTKLQILFNYLIVEGYPNDEYKILSSWPRRDLTTLDTNLSFSDLKFHQQETLILEER